MYMQDVDLAGLHPRNVMVVVMMMEQGHSAKQNRTRRVVFLDFGGKYVFSILAA